MQDLRDVIEISDDPYLWPEQKLMVSIFVEQLPGYSLF